MIDVALFPIPECVSFPGTIFPLHVFEPRYRTMVEYCIEHDMPMGVCHTQKLVRPAKQQQTLEEALSSNQATYKPYPVFSAGRVELIKTLEDGRMLISVHINERYQAIEARQTLPFSIYACEVYSDEPVNDLILKQAEQLKQKILKRMLAITSSAKEAQQLLGSDEWQNKKAVAFSFEIMGIVQCNAELKQQILEKRSPVDRLEAVLRLLNE